ncbi:putative F-box/LRR-repeat protein At3g58880 [Salvia miltiorrhiza]|uniref:putative F-box/LRR-repeat protein At3g58880 n=1 Tax=Salvia miltiorrhiza TaxID=226208 RepID=UPI0025ACB383|nr:putative F-box/LRR-repeat protein At3g58880 [Salvia miltiorrhiza]XP_057801636.1 putative F-box/LRR-repeat protein At3g58880 [Salvia miltiorrhiza]XP_057801637.1 putative F-box/LRR-repeat protein At3g58880 [Salvia miltiorrhiza]XP_057801638.1 putative F-box/LRR-repeat protein At3g58880 [Salvia miltiorrhiza]
MLKEKRERLAISTDVSKVDRISVLPKEVLGLILSLLTAKEATATSILCSSWRYLWVLTCKTTMDFDGTQSVRKIIRFMENFGFTDPSVNKACIEPLEEERCKFVRWVDHVIVSNQLLDQRSNLEEFKVYFDLNQTHREKIDDWLTYAFSRKVERLELRLTSLARGIARFYPDSHLCYEFPYKRGNLPNNFEVLKKLCLHLVSVSGEVVQLFLEKCPLLEQVSVSGSQALLSLEIVATFPSFKCLEISLCHYLKSVVLRDSNVVTIKYSGKIIPFVLVNVPLLTKLWIKALLLGPSRLKDVVGMFSPVLPQLEMLKIYPSHIYWEESQEFVSAVEMCNLKQLVVNIGYYYRDTDSLLSFVNLINAAPCLERFVVEAVHQDSKKDKSLDGACARNYTLRPRVNVHVKEVEFVGYRGVFNHLELIMHFVEKDVALKNIIIDPRSFKYHLHRQWDRIYRHEVEDGVFAMAYAKEQLKEHVPSRINVKIL